MVYAIGSAGAVDNNVTSFIIKRTLSLLLSVKRSQPTWVFNVTAESQAAEVEGFLAMLK